MSIVKQKKNGPYSKFVFISFALSQASEAKESCYKGLPKEKEILAFHTVSLWLALHHPCPYYHLDSGGTEEEMRDVQEQEKPGQDLAVSSATGPNGIITGAPKATLNVASPVWENAVKSHLPPPQL